MLKASGFPAVSSKPLCSQRCLFAVIYCQNFIYNCNIYISVVRATYCSRNITLYFVILLKYGDEYKLPSSLLCTFLHSTATCTLLVSLGTAFSHTMELSSLRTRLPKTLRRVRFDVFTAVTVKNGVFCDIKPQFVLHRRHIKSPLQSPAS
jgi:hypothetical protein